MGLIMRSSPWTLQILLSITMFLFGFVAALRGISLSQLADIYNSDLTTMSIAIAIGGMGATSGFNCVGFLVERFPEHQHIIMACLVLCSALGTAAMPFGQFVSVFCGANLLFGVGYAISAVANAICLRIWRNHSWGAGPFVHSMFLFSLLGLLSAPPVCSLFLREDLGNEYEENLKANLSLNESNWAKNQNLDDKNMFIAIPYVISGLVYLILALFILQCSAVVNGVQEDGENDLDHHVDIRHSEEDKMPNSYKWQRRLLVAITANFFVADYTMIMSISNFLLVALDRGSLGLSNAEGALIISIFFLGQVIICAINSILSSCFNPYQTLTTCLTLVFGSVSLMWFSWDKSYTLVATAFFVLGIGSGPLYANTLIWLDQFIPMEAKTTGFLQSSAALGMLLSGLIFGPFVEEFPQLFPSFFLVFFVALLLVFGSGEIVGRAVQNQREGTIKMLVAQTKSDREMEGKFGGK